MDQLLGAFGIDWKLLLAQMVNFGVLLVALWYFLYRPVLKILDERRMKIAQGVTDAERAGEKLAQADVEATTIVSAADTEAAELLASARIAANTERIRLVKEAEQRAAAIEKDAASCAAEASACLIRESEHEIARLAVIAAGKVIGEKK